MVARAELGSIGANPAYPREDNKRTKNIFIHTIKPGDEVDDGVRVFNYTKEQRTVEVKAVDSILSSDGSFSCRQSVEKKKDVGAWTTLETEKVVIKPESNVIVPFTVAVPTNATNGEHGGCITIQDTKNFASTTGGGVQLGFRSAIRMAITVTGDLVKKLTIERIDIHRIDNGNYTVSPVAKNDGNVSLDVTARAQLRSVFGQKTDIKSADYPIIAGATTGWPFEFKRPFWGGYYKAYTSLTYNADPDAGLGELTKEKKRISQQSEYFLMVPAPQAIAIYVTILLIPIIVLAVWLWRRKRAKRDPSKQGKSKSAWVQYTVEAGDTISLLAESHHIAWKKLAKKNKLRPPYTLEVGQVILLPRISTKPLPTSPQPHIQATQAQSQGTQAQQAPLATQSPAPGSAQKSLQPVAPPASHGWTSPRESSYPQNVSPDQGTGPQYVPTQFPEYYQEHRASEYEVPNAQNGWASPLGDPKGYIDDADLVPELRSLWDQDVEPKAGPKPKAKKSKAKAKRPKKQ